MRPKTKWGKGFWGRAEKNSFSTPTDSSCTLLWPVACGRVASGLWLVLYVDRQSYLPGNWLWDYALPLHMGGNYSGNDTNEDLFFRRKHYEYALDVQVVIAIAIAVGIMHFAGWHRSKSTGDSHKRLFLQPPPATTHTLNQLMVLQCARTSRSFGGVYDLRLSFHN